jgi:tetratricopeptide (TPR) repeat protein
LKSVSLKQAAFILALLVVFIIVINAFSSANSLTTGIPQSQASPSASQIDGQDNRHFQMLYQIEATAAQSGWTNDLHHNAGERYFALGDFDNAIAHWEIAAPAFADDPAFTRQLVAAYLEQRRWSQASNALANLLQMAPEDRWAHYHLGLIKAAFNPSEAIQHLRLAAVDPAYAHAASSLMAVLNSDTTDVATSMQVGSALSELELWDYAELAFQHSYDLNPEMTEALAYVGLARDRQGRDGSGFIEQAIQLDTQNPQVRYLQGLHLRETGDDEGSLQAFIQAAVLDPQNPAIYAELGGAYRSLGDLQRAEYWLKMAVALSGNDAQFQELLALFYAEEATNLTSEGMAVLGETAGLLPNNPDVKASFGWALHSIGETQAGLAEIDAALAIMPNNARGLYYKAQIKLESGALEEAVPLLERLADMPSPYQDEARRTLATLNS